MNAQRATLGNVSNLVTFGVVGVGLYFLYKLFSGAAHAASSTAAAVAQGYSTAVDALATTFYTLWGPTEDFGPSVYYTVAFPDGTSHAIGADQVNAKGQFTWTGYPAGSQPAVTLQIVQDSTGKKYAAAA